MCSPVFKEEWGSERHIQEGLHAHQQPSQASSTANMDSETQNTANLTKILSLAPR